MKKTPTKIGQPGGVTAAFSLVEVVLAIGITSFTLLTMVALLPMGLGMAHTAANATTQSQIVEYARNQMEMTSFANLSSWGTTNLYFDNQGLPTTASDPEQIYAVSFGVINVGLSINGASTNAYLGPNANLTNAAGASEADAQLVQVYIVNRTAPGPAATNLVTIIVPNSGF
jgi:uncharacterized protein (TIGR02598 family)